LKTGADGELFRLVDSGDPVDTRRYNTRPGNKDKHLGLVDLPSSPPPGTVHKGRKKKHRPNAAEQSANMKQKEDERVRLLEALARLESELRTGETQKPPKPVNSASTKEDTDSFANASKKSNERVGSPSVTPASASSKSQEDIESEDDEPAPPVEFRDVDFERHVGYREKKKGDGQFSLLLNYQAVIKFIINSQK
jgi:hypothetical protein